MEAKYGIYGQCLGFRNLDIFEGVRVDYKGRLGIVFKLTSANMVMSCCQYKKYTRHRQPHADVISCKIRGLRSQSE
jgi:hypothetical protein